MDHMVQCSTLLFVEHIVLGFFGMCSTVMCAFLVHRRIRADRAVAVNCCKLCKQRHVELDHEGVRRFLRKKLEDS